MFADGAGPDEADSTAGRKAELSGAMRARRRVVSAVMFFPRGGSAHAARAIAAGLPEHGWECTLVSGSRSDVGAEADARSFYAGIDVVPVEMTPGGGESTGGSGRSDRRPALRAPMHPSYEDRDDAPDGVFAELADAELERHVAAWSAALRAAGAPGASVLHLHHLTPLNDAAPRVAPRVPVVGQLHGTELLMLEEIARSADRWTYGRAWRERMRAWAAACERVVVAPGAVDRAAGVLGLEPDRFVPLANGFDPGVFHPLDVDRLAVWHRHLVERPRGWLPGAAPASVRYGPQDLDPIRAGGTVFVYVGRYTEIKRLPMLIRAFERARRELSKPIALVLVGGHPGEWEGMHPVDAIAQSAARNVYLAGWHGQEELPELLAAADAVVLASQREQFGQALVEAMACGLPAIAAASVGPRTIVDDGETGWLFALDDERGLAAALCEAASDPAERRRRAAAARAHVLRHYTWPAIVAELSGQLDRVAVDGERELDAAAI